MVFRNPVIQYCKEVYLALIQLKPLSVFLSFDASITLRKPLILKKQRAFEVLKNVFGYHFFARLF